MNSIFGRLPDELVNQISDHSTTFDADADAIANTFITMEASKDPSIPPADGSTPLLNLPRELRRAIFSYVLPPINKLIEPNQKKTTKPQAATNTAPVVPAPPVLPFALAVPLVHSAPGSAFLTYSPHQPARRRAATKPKKKKKKAEEKPALPVGDALVICKTVAAEILVLLYEERTFALNVYEGIQDGGIEFLNSGRQRLQYHEHFKFVRFKRFEGPDNPFAFSRIKRLLVRVYPATEAASQHKNSRHDAMHTHFMIRALVQLLKFEGCFGLNRLQVRFVEPQSNSWRPHPWQNTTNLSPRNSSIHGIPVVEIILRGLMELRSVNTAVCEMPPGLYRDTGLAAFVDRLQGVITSKLDPSTMDDEITTKIEGARDMLDNWIHTTMFGTRASRAITALTDSDFLDVQDANTFTYSSDEDGFFEPHVPVEETSVQETANSCSPPLRNLYEKRITSNDVQDEEMQDIISQAPTPKTKPSLAINVKNGAARTCSTRRSARMSPLASSSRESSGGASLFGIISIVDDDDHISPGLGSSSNGKSGNSNNNSSAGRSELRRSDRVRARNAFAADDDEMDTWSMDLETLPSRLDRHRDTLG